jgi:hypothetical protein
MAGCVKVDYEQDYHHHCYGDYYVSVSVDPFEYGHSSLPFPGFLWARLLLLATPALRQIRAVSAATVPGARRVAADGKLPAAHLAWLRFALTFKVGKSRRPLTDAERDMVADATVQHIKLCNWMVERGPTGSHAQIFFGAPEV